MKIFDYEEVVMNWDSFTYPIAVGTPVSVDGVLADNSSAHGLIARTVFAKPDGGDTLKIMTGGFIDMEEIVAGYGQELSSAAVQALCGIHFYKDGVCIPTGGSGGGDDSQKWKEETSTQLFSETVTTVAVEFGNTANLSYADQITAETLTVTFDGTEYVCPLIQAYGERYYGGFDGEAPDFSEYPFFIVSAGTPNVNTIVTSAPGEHTVSAVASITTYTETFIDGVKKNSAFIVHFSSYVEGITADKTVQEIGDAYDKGYSIIGMFANHSDYNEVYYLQDIYVETGAVSFVNFAITVADALTSVSIKYIRSNSENVNTFTTGDVSLH